MNKIKLFLLLYVLPCVVNLTLFKIWNLTHINDKIGESLVICAFIPVVNIMELISTIICMGGELIIMPCINLVFGDFIKWIVK
jgi:hypothetical protein